MIEYPKAVYKGENKDDYTTRVVENADEEIAAQAEGFVDYYDLDKSVKKSKKQTVLGVDDGNGELLGTASIDSELAAS